MKKLFLLAGLLIGTGSYAQVQPEVKAGSVTVGAPTVGNEGQGSINAQSYYVNGSPVVGASQITAYSVLCNNTNALAYPAACTNITIVNNSPTLGQTYGDGTLVAVETLGNVAGPSFHVGNNFLTIDNGAQFSYGATSLYAQMNFAGATITGSRAAGTFSTVMSGTTGNTAGSENYAGFDGYCTASANDNGTGLTNLTAFGSCFGGNFITKLTNGATYWQGAIGVEVDNEMDTGSSAMLSVGIQAVRLASSTQQGALEDAALACGAQTGAVGWKNCLALANPVASGAWPYTSSSVALQFLQSGTLATIFDGSNVTCTSYCLKFNGFTVDGTGNEVVNGLTSTSGAVNTTNSALNLEVGAVAVQSLTTTGGAHINTSPLISIGNQFTAASSCGGTITITPGTFGPESGYFTVPTGGTNCQFTMTIGGAVPVSAPHGWYCSGEDSTSKVLAVQYTQSTTTCVLQVTAATNDLILWGVVRGY